MMRKLLLVIALCAVLPGCAVWDAYNMTKYDPNEYRIITEIRTEARQFKKECDNPLLSRPNAWAMADKTELFEVYSENVPNNNNTIKASKELNSIAQGLADSYRQPTLPGAVFCKIKFDSIETNASTMQRVIGNKPR